MTPAPSSSHVRVGRFSRFRDLKRAVDSLSVARVTERRMTVLGRGLRWSPPLTAGRAARLGGSLGAVIGSACLLLFWLTGALAAGFSWLVAAVLGALAGGGLGLVLGVAFWRYCRDRALLPESGHVDVERYELLVDRDDVPKARDLLGD
jgi:hypothetical protein